MYLVPSRGSPLPGQQTSAVSLVWARLGISLFSMTLIPLWTIFEVEPRTRMKVLPLLRRLSTKRLAFPGSPSRVRASTTLSVVVVREGQLCVSRERHPRRLWTLLPLACTTLLARHAAPPYDTQHLTTAHYTLHYKRHNK